MFYAVDISFDVYGPRVLPPSRVIRLERQRIYGTTESANGFTAVVPESTISNNDESTTTFDIELSDGMHGRGHLLVFSDEIKVYPGKGAGGVCFVVEGTLEHAIRAAVKCMVFSFGRQGEFDLNIFGNEKIRDGLPLMKDLSVEDAMNLQSDDQYYICARQGSNNLKLYSCDPDGGDDGPGILDEYWFLPSV